MRKNVDLPSEQPSVILSHLSIRSWEVGVDEDQRRRELTENIHVVACACERTRPRSFMFVSN